MKSKISILVGISLFFGILQSFAADTNVATSKDWNAKVESTGISVDTEALDAVDAWLQDEWWDSLWDPTTTEDSTSTAVDTWLNSAWKAALAPAKGWVGNYKEVDCASKDYFTANSCNQCFEWWSKAVWEKITWLTDSWTNPNSTEQVIYKDEQKFPEMVSVGNSVWISNPMEIEKFWKYSDEILFIDSATWSGKQEFLLEWWKTINFLEWDLGASYALQSSDVNEWEATGILKFYLSYHDTDESAKESEVKNHTECVAFTAWAKAIAAPVPTTPQEVTQVKTWPETIFVILAALLLAFGLIRYRKKA